MAFNAKQSNKEYLEEATLNLVDPETGVELEVDGKPVSITVYGAASPKHRKAVDVLQGNKRKRGNREATLAESRSESLEFLVALSKDTSNFVDDDELPITTAEQFRTLYGDEHISWIRDQVTSFIGEPNSFMKRNS